MIYVLVYSGLVAFSFWISLLLSKELWPSVTYQRKGYVLLGLLSLTVVTMPFVLILLLVFDALDKWMDEK